MTLRSAVRLSGTLLQNIRKGKFYSILRPFWDRKYRVDIRRLRRIVGHGEYRLEERQVPLYSIQFSHAINYPKWVDLIVRRINDWEGLYHPPPIKVVLDLERSGIETDIYLVVDGNHRLMALKRCYGPGHMVTVLVMVAV